MSYSASQDDKKPAPQARKGEGKMGKKELQSIMDGLVTDAETLIDGEISPLRVKAFDYYRGRPFGNESPGRSQVIITELRDNVHGVLPSFLRLFFGPERVVEFVPRTEAGAAKAQQATDYVQYVFAEDNKGFLQTYNVLKDGLVKALGVFKWWWDTGTPKAVSDEGISMDALVALAARDDVELTSYEDGEEEGTVNVEYTIKAEGKPCVAAIPPEEFIFSRGARDGDEAIMVGHRTRKRRGDLIAMGYDEDVIDEHAGDGPTKLESNVESIQRNVATSKTPGDEPNSGESNDEIAYVEAYVYLDVDGDGESELRKICMIGDEHFVIHNEPTDERPFSIFCPIPEPHTILGQSFADLTMDLQLTKSNITRAMLDSLALSIFPRMAFQEQFVSVEDILSTEIGAPIRTRKENAVQPIAHPFTGEGAMPILQYFDEVSENRTGHAKGAMGLDSNALQSSTQEAVGAAVQASQEQTELMARVFAEQALKPMFRGLYRMLAKYKPKARIVRLRGSYVEIDTAAWDADMDVTVNVAIGTTMVEKRIAALMNIKATQEQILFGPLGPTNPLVTMGQYRETLARIVELSGFKDTHSFFQTVPGDWAPPPPPPPPPSPETILAQAQLEVEKMKTEKDLQIQQAKLTLQQQQQEFDQDLAIRKLSIDSVLRRYAIDAQFKSSHTQQQTELDARHEETALDAAMDLARMHHEQESSVRQHALAADAQSHDQMMAEQEHALARQQAAQPEAPETTA